MISEAYLYFACNYIHPIFTHCTNPAYCIDLLCAICFGRWDRIVILIRLASMDNKWLQFKCGVLHWWASSIVFSMIRQCSFFVKIEMSRFDIAVSNWLVSLIETISLLFFRGPVVSLCLFSVFLGWYGNRSYWRSYSCDFLSDWHWVNC